jgi:hypothetical protein
VRSHKIADRLSYLRSGFAHRFLLMRANARNSNLLFVASQRFILRIFSHQLAHANLLWDLYLHNLFVQHAGDDCMRIDNSAQ